MKRTQKLLALLLALMLCLGLFAGCGGNTAASSDTQTGEEQESASEEDSSAEGASGESTATSEEGSEVAGSAVYTVGDLELTEVNDEISTLVYVSCNGKEITVPVLNSANWDNTQVADDKSFVEVTNTTGEEMISPEGSYYCTYYSEEQDYYDMEDMAQQYADVFVDDDGTSNATIYPVTTSSDGSVQAMAIHGIYQSWEIYQYLITVDLDDEYAVLDLSFYTDDPSIVQPILDYWDLPDPLTAS